MYNGEVRELLQFIQPILYPYPIILIFVFHLKTPLRNV